MFSPDLIRPGVVSAALIILTGAFFSVRAIANRYSDTCDTVLAAFFLYNLLSGIWCVLFGVPLSVYAGELLLSVVSMLFYFAGRSDDSSRLFSLTFIISVGITGLIGIVLFITGPKLYIDYLMRLQLISKPDIETMRVRMHSVIGSTLMGFLPAVGMLVSVRLFLDLEKEKKKFAAAAFLLMLFLAFMSNQRSAMAAAVLILIYLNFLAFFSFRLLPFKYLAMECGLILAGAAGLFLFFRGAFMKVYYRLVSLPGSIAQRSDQWVGAANNMKSIWLGNGLGANGHRAIGYTEHLIADGGLAKLYVECGIIGTSIFVFLILLVLKRGFSDLKKTAPETGIVLITILTSIGSNMMSFALSVPVFYYYMGSLVKKAAGREEQ